MKFLFRWAFRFLILGIVLAVALVLLKDTLVKSWAEYRIRAETGLEVKISRMEVGLLTPTLKIEGFKLYNSAEFGGSTFFDVPELHVEWDPRELTAQKMRLKLVRFHMNEVNIVESRNGQTNIVNLMARLEKLTPKNSDGSSSGGVEFGGIDTLNLTLGKIRYSSLRRPGKPTEIDLALKNEVIQNVKSWTDLSNVVLKILLRRGITILGLQTTAPPSLSPAHMASACLHRASRPHPDGCGQLTIDPGAGPHWPDAPRAA